MRAIKLYISEKEYGHFVELVKNLNYVKKIQTDEDAHKKEVIINLKNGFKEMQLIKKGKIKTTPLKDFIDDL